MRFLNTSKSGKTFSVGTYSSYNETLREGGNDGSSGWTWNTALQTILLNFTFWIGRLFNIKISRALGNLRMANARCRRFKCGLLQSSTAFAGPLCWGVESRVKGRDREKTWLWMYIRQTSRFERVHVSTRIILPENASRDRRDNPRLFPMTH
jgi:hypothetical protein